MLNFLSCVCQKPVLKSMEQPHFRTPTPHKTLSQFWYPLKSRPPWESMCKIWLESIQPLWCSTCMKSHVLCRFFVEIYLSNSLPRLQITASGRFECINGSNDVFSQLLAPVIFTAVHLGVQSPENFLFWCAWIDVFKPNMQNIAAFILRKLLVRFQ